MRRAVTQLNVTLRETMRRVAVRRDVTLCDGSATRCRVMRQEMQIDAMVKAWTDPTQRDATPLDASCRDGN